MSFIKMSSFVPKVSLLGDDFVIAISGGKNVKIKMADLAAIIAPFVPNASASGFIPVTGTVLPNPITQANGYTIVGAGTYTQTTGGSVTTTEVLNVLGWNGTTWSLVKGIALDNVFKKNEVNQFVFTDSQAGNALIKELYLQGYTNGLYISRVARNNVTYGGWQIEIRNSGGTIVARHLQNVSQQNYAEIVEVGGSGIKGYAIVDWNVLTDGEVRNAVTYNIKPLARSLEYTPGIQALQFKADITGNTLGLNLIKVQSAGGKNLFWTDKAYVNANNYVQANANLIKLDTTKTQLFWSDSFNLSLTFYDANFAVISTVNANNTAPVAIPANSVYISYKVYTSRLNITTLQLEYGAAATSYEPFILNMHSLEYARVSTVENGLVVANTRITNLETTSLKYESGKNLLNPAATGVKRGYAIFQDGHIETNQYVTTQFVSEPIEIKEGETFVINTAWNMSNTFMGLYDANLNPIAGTFKVPRGNNTPSSSFPALPYGNTLAWVTGAKYAMFTGNITTLDSNLYQVEKGTVATPVEPFAVIPPLPVRQYIARSAVPAVLASDLIVPETITVQRNKKFVFYNDALIRKSGLKVVNAQFSGELGVNYGNIYSGTPAAVATGNLTFSVIDETVSEPKRATIPYRVVDIPAAWVGQTLNWLAVGDSFTDIGNWNNEVKVHLQADGITVNQLGTKGIAGSKSENRSGGDMTFFTQPNGAGVEITVSGVTTAPSDKYGTFNNVGYYGAVYRDANNFDWTVIGNTLNGGAGKIRLGRYGVTTGLTEFPATGVLTKITTNFAGDATLNYTAVDKVNFNPFWNPTTNQLDFQNYIDRFGFPIPDVLAIAFGYNDVGSSSFVTDANLATIIGRFKTVIDRFRAQFPTKKVLIEVHPLGSLKNSNAMISNVYREYNQVRLFDALVANFGQTTTYASYVTVAPSFFGVDRINGFANSTIVISDRYPTVTTNYTGDSSHCNEAGMRQIGDMIVPYLYYLLRP